MALASGVSHFFWFFFVFCMKGSMNCIKFLETCQSLVMICLPNFASTAQTGFGLWSHYPPMFAGKEHRSLELLFVLDEVRVGKQDQLQHGSWMLPAGHQPSPCIGNWRWQTPHPASGCCTCLEPPTRWCHAPPTALDWGGNSLAGPLHWLSISHRGDLLLLILLQVHRGGLLLLILLSLVHCLFLLPSALTSLVPTDMAGSSWPLSLSSWSSSTFTISPSSSLPLWPTFCFL